MERFINQFSCKLFLWRELFSARSPDTSECGLYLPISNSKINTAMFRCSNSASNSQCLAKYSHEFYCSWIIDSSFAFYISLLYFCMQPGSISRLSHKMLLNLGHLATVSAAFNIERHLYVPINLYLPRHDSCMYMYRYHMLPYIGLRMFVHFQYQVNKSKHTIWDKSFWTFLFWVGFSGSVMRE